MICDRRNKEEGVAKTHLPRHAQWVFALGLLAVVGCSAKGQGEVERSQPAAQSTTKVILVSQEAPWLVAATAPVAATLRGEGPVPMLAVIGTPPGEAMAAVLRRIEARQAWLFGPAPSAEADAAVRHLQPKVVATGLDPVGGSFVIAKKFWSSPAEAFAAREKDPRGLILAAALAARKSAPLLICESAGDGSRLADNVRKLGLKRLVFVSADMANDRRAAQRIKARIELMDAAAAERQLAASVAADQPRTIILTREPTADGKLAATAWLAPYLSLLRGAPLAIASGDDAPAAEASVFRLIENHHLRPRTLTILADYKAIGVKRVVVGQSAARDPKGHSKKDPPYTIDVEPCMPVDFGGVVRLGVGRIPLATLEDASALLVRGALRTTRAEGGPVRLLMAANSRPDVYPLPLCETVSRLTAEEFANCGVMLDAFYGVPADSPSALRSMRDANIVLFEGHTLYQDLFPKGRDSDEEPEDEEPAEEEASPDADDLDAGGMRNGANVLLSKRAPDLPSLRPGVGEMDGLPIVILQSCHSLKPEVFQKVHLKGGAAMLGASTAIHSGSGSALAKALCDSVLYRDASLGEALRDAQNFLMCLQELRGKRNHNELVKIQRVALSFRLWGDPELRVLEDCRPRLEPVAARWTSAGAVEVQVPDARLPTVATRAYLAAMVPGSEAAGIVQRPKGSAARRLSPVYFFRLGLPDGMEPRVPDALRDQVVLRLDRSAKLAYLLVMPQRERPGMKTELQLGTRREKAGR